MSVFNADHLLTDTCTLAKYSGGGEAYDADTGNLTETYGTGASLWCLPLDPDYRWGTRWPQVDLTRALRMHLPAGTGAVPRDKITYNSKVYRVLAVYPARYAGSDAFERVDLEHIEALDA